MIFACLQNQGWCFCRNQGLVECLHCDLAVAHCSFYCWTISKEYIWATAWPNLQNDLCAQRTLSLVIRPVVSESSLCTLWVAKDSNFLQAHKTNKWPVHPTKTQISLGIRPVWSESSLGAQVICWFCHSAAHFKVGVSFVWIRFEWVPLFSSNFRFRIFRQRKKSYCWLGC